MTKWILVGAVLLSFISGVRAEEMVPSTQETAAPASTLELVSAVLGTNVENREIVGEAASFDASVTQVACLTKVKTSAAPTTLHHVYSVDGKEINDIPLNVNGSPWRTWSRKSVWPGAWKVEIKDADGNVLKAIDFEVAKGMTETAPTQPQ